MGKKTLGSLLTVFSSLLFLMFLWGGLLKSPGKPLIGREGGSIAPYYSALYHARYDASGFRSHAMNYPYGEVIVHTDSQVLLVNPIRFISRHFIDITGHTLAVINLAMFLSVVLASLFVFLIFLELGISWWFGSLAAAGITFLSPQLAFMTTRMSLSWAFWIPLIIWLIIRFDRSRKPVYTVLIGIATFCAGLMHLHYLVAIAFLAGGYWFFRFLFYRKASTFWYRDALHIFFQFVIPALALQFLVLLNDDVTDRSLWLNSFNDLLIQPAGLFIPQMQPWTFLTGEFSMISKLPSEAAAYPGTVALAGWIAGIGWIICKVIRREPALRVTRISAVNVQFWISFTALLFAFGLPLAMKSTGLSDMAQEDGFRILSVFFWLFFYLLNIVVFSSLYYRAFTPSSLPVWKVVAGAAVILLLTEGFFNLRRIAAAGADNTTSYSGFQDPFQSNGWSGQVEPFRYQAILPVPFFHMGSDIIRVEGSFGVKEAAMHLSLKTGLPLVGADLYRMSSTQALSNYALFTDPVERHEFPDFLPDERPLLLLLMDGYIPSDEENRMIKHSRWIFNEGDFALYELPVAVIRRLNLIYKDEISGSFQSAGLTGREGWQASDADRYFFVDAFEDQDTGTAFHGTGALPLSSRMRHTVWSDTLSGMAGESVLLASFWVNDYRKPEVLRTTLEFSVTDPDSGESFVRVSGFSRNIRAFSGDWALIEISVNVPANQGLASLSVRNSVLPGDTKYLLDELMIREEGLNVYREEGRWLWMNNRRVRMQ